MAYSHFLSIMNGRIEGNLTTGTPSTFLPILRIFFWHMRSKIRDFLKTLYLNNVVERILLIKESSLKGMGSNY